MASVYPSCTACLLIFFLIMLSLSIYPYTFYLCRPVLLAFGRLSISSLISFLQSLSAIPIFVFLCLPLSVVLLFCLCLQGLLVFSYIFIFVFYIFSSAFCHCPPLSIVFLFYDWPHFVWLQNNGTTVHSVHVFAARTPGGN